MQLRHIILILITVVYAAYYVGVSKGMIKKDVRYGNEAESRTALQRIVDAVTPDSPEEKRLRNKDTLEDLYFQLNLAKKNYESYVEWRSEAINNPPE